MFSKLRLLPFIVVAVLVFPSCNRLPKHARFIPKDAFMVVGIHTNEIGKSVAWNTITGGNLLEELRKAGAGDKAPQVLKDIEHSGINFNSTLYFYAKPDTRFKGSMKLAMVLPVADDEKLTAYIRKHFPSLKITEKDGRNETFIEDKLALSWNDEVLMAMSPLMRKVEHKEEARMDSLGGEAFQAEPYTWTEEQPDAALTLQEMATLFQPVKASGIDELARFKDLEKAGHDITFWMSYDAMMDLYNTYGGGDVPGMGMMGMTMGNTLFKGAAMAAGFDFEKGKIDGLMRYYTSDSMKAVAKEFGRENIDGDMLRRLPAPGLNMAAGYHLSPAAIKLMLEKMNLSGMANLALMSQGITIDDVLGGFTGDMVFAINNFRMERRMQVVDSTMREEYDLQPYEITSPAMDFVFALKIGDRAKLMKLFNLFGKSELLRPTAPNTYSLYGGKGSLVIGDKYVALSSNAGEAEAFLRERGGAMPDAVHKEIAGHPLGMWADARSFLLGASTVGVVSSTDSAALGIVRKTFSTFSFNGGEFRKGANEYRMSLQFADKEQNSLLQLIRMGQEMAALRNGAAVAVR